jgi:hypothetical protein
MLSSIDFPVDDVHDAFPVGERIPLSKKSLEVIAKP